MVIFFLPVKVMRVLGVGHVFPRLPSVSDPSGLLCAMFLAMDSVVVETWSLNMVKRFCAAMSSL